MWGFRLAELSGRTAFALALGTWIGFVGGCQTNRILADRDVPARPDSAPTDEFAPQRDRMVRDQLAARDITDPRVLAAMRRVPRHRFVPPSLIGSAYDDNALPLMLGQTISQPYIVAFMTQALDLDGSERVLEIGTGSGYQAALLAETAREVFTVEIIPELTQYARNVLDSLGYENIKFRTGDGYEGWPEYAPFDAVIVTAAPGHVPQPLIDQLKPEGRLVIPVGRREQDLVLIEKSGSGTSRRTLIPVRFVPMTGKAQNP